MKKILIVFLCLFTIFSMCSCKKLNSDDGSSVLSDTFHNESIIITEPQPETTTTDINSEKTSSIENTTSVNSETSQPEENLNDVEKSDGEENSYDDIVCTNITSFRKTGFSINGSNTMVFVQMPSDWEFEKSTNGYSITKNSQTIGTVTKSVTTSSDGSVNVFNSEITTNNIKVTHSINKIAYANNTSYTRTLCYNYTDEKGNSKKVFITIPYQEIDSSAVYKMITEVDKGISSTEKNLGILQIQDNRNKILILGNSFINSSSIGSILQTMCGDEVAVEAHSRGYAHVGTYTKDTNMMQNISSGNYSAVYMCGFYDNNAVLDFKDMIDACEQSDTKLAIFPAHNENRSVIDSAIKKYPNTVLLDWKAEVDNFINTGIDVSNFCIPDAHNHSTPLAGYIGAHMIYRAVFNKIPQVTQFTEVSKSQIDLLGEYVETGTIILLDNTHTYVIE